jgi:hypothetical protein
MSSAKSVCYMCNEVITHNVVTCATCKMCFHADHSGTTMANWKKMGKKRNGWVCDHCKIKSVYAEVLGAKNCEECPSKDEIIRQLQQDLAQTQLELRQCKDELKRVCTNGSFETPKRPVKNRRVSKSKGSKNSPTVAHSNPFELLAIEEDDVAASPVISNSKRPKSSTPKNRKKRRILLVADSHGQNCSAPLQEAAGPDYDVFVVSHPGAPFDFVVDSATRNAKEFTKEDHVIILAGTNDFRRKDRPVKFDTSEVKKLAVSTNVLLSHVPYRFDSPSYNHCISRANSWLDKSVDSISALHTVNLTSLKRSHYTRHGLHLNAGGKRKLASILNRAVKGCFTPETPMSDSDFLGM